MKRTLILTAALVLSILSGNRRTWADGWAPTPAKPPSTLSKITTGTKNFFGKVGQTVGLTKPKTKTPFSGATTNSKPKTTTAAQKSASLFGKSAPKKPQSPSDFLALPRNDPW